MPTWGGSETARSPAQALAQRWVNKFGQSKQRYRFVAIFRELLETYSWRELEKIINNLHEAHKNGQITVTSPALVSYVAKDVLADNFLKTTELKIL